MSARINIGLMGYGGIGRVHSMCYRQLPFIYPQSPAVPVLHTVCTSRAETAEAAKAEAGFEKAVCDTDALMADRDIHVVDVTLPNQLHLPAVAAALSAGKHVYCEKPLAGTIADARAIVRAVRSAPGSFGMVFQYRYIPALMRARELVEEGKLGRIFTYRAEYLHSGYQDAARPLSWRMKKDEGGSGALGSLRFDLMDPSFLYWFDESSAGGQYGGERGWQRLDTVANYPGSKTPPPPAPLGWTRAHAENQHRFLSSVARREEPSPSIVDGLRAQLVIDAVERSAATEGAWTVVEHE